MSLVTNAHTTAQQSRVPAWKRLGLKLKYAKESAEERSPELDGTNPVTVKSTGVPKSNEHLVNQSGEDVRPSKKRKTSKGSSEQEPSAPEAVTAATDHERSNSNTAQPAISSTETGLKDLRAGSDLAKS